MCDRTQEFLSLVHASSGGAASASSARLRRLQGSTSSSGSSGSGADGKNAFPEAAREIARGIHRTSSLLARLTSLVRKQGLFDDPTEEINTLIFRIKQDLDALNAQCDGAQQSIDRHAHTQSSSSSSFLFGRGSDAPSQLAQHNVKVVSQLKGDLFNATKGFKQVLELRSSKMKDQQLRRVELVGRGQISALNSLQIAKTPYNNTAASSSSSSSSSSSFLASSATQTSSSSSVVVAKKKPLPSPYASLESGDASSRFALPYSEEQRNQQQQQLLLEPVAAAQYYDAREQAVTEVEKTIGELGSLFKRLATMLQEQQELVERIDEDVENAVANTENAKNQLVKALESASSNRGMFMKIGGILVIFILFFVLFLM